MAIVIALDAGHGSETAGKRTPKLKKNTDLCAAGEQLREHTANVWVCNYAYAYLRKYGFTVLKSAWNDTKTTDDPDVPLFERQNLIKKNKATLSISVHFNAHGNGITFTNAAGIETLISSTKDVQNNSKAFATLVQDRLNRLGRKDRGVKEQDLAMCNSKYMGTEGSILCELGFMTNKEEAHLMGSKEYLKKCGHQIALGVYDYLATKPEKECTIKDATRAEIIWIQIKLNLKGFNTPTTGVWDDNMIKAIQDYWLSAKGITCTGKVVSLNCIKLLSL